VAADSVVAGEEVAAAVSVVAVEVASKASAEVV
jgi:hypothetical protein